MVAGVLLLLSSQNPLKLMSSGAGYLALLLTLARAAWMSWIIGIVVFLPSLKPKFQMRLIVTLMSLLILILPLTTIEPFSQVINSRVQSFFAGKQDGSYIDRSMGYTNLLNDAMTEFQGRGIGYVLRDPRLGSNDSGVLTLLLSLGWLGTIPYLGGLLLVIGSILRGQEASFDPFASACRAIAIATFSQISLNTAMLAAFGMILWSFIGLAMAARVYYLQVGSGARDIRG
jgi:O-antigen ligase